MSNNKEQIIDQIKFLGIEFYKRTRIEEHEIQINAQQNITEYPGLLVLGKDSYLGSSLSASNPTWSMLAYQTIELTILDLIINDFIELTVFTSKKCYLANSFKYKYKNYYLAIKNEYRGEDNLSKYLIKFIEYTTQDNHKKSNLRIIIRHLLYEYLGREKQPHKQAQKAFITALLHRYNQDCAWLKLNTHFGVLKKKHELDMPVQKRDELKNSYNRLSHISIVLRRESQAFYKYSNVLYTIINSEFQRRKMLGYNKF